SKSSPSPAKIGNGSGPTPASKATRSSSLPLRCPIPRKCATPGSPILLPLSSTGPACPPRRSAPTIGPASPRASGPTDSLKVGDQAEGRLADSQNEGRDYVSWIIIEVCGRIAGGRDGGRGLGFGQRGERAGAS